MDNSSTRRSRVEDLASGISVQDNERLSIVDYNKYHDLCLYMQMQELHQWHWHSFASWMCTRLLNEKSHNTDFLTVKMRIRREYLLLLYLFLFHESKEWEPETKT